MRVDALPRNLRFRWLLPAVVLGLLAALLAPAPAAMAATGVRVVNVGSGRCLDVANNNQASGGRVIVYDCHAGDNQAWTVTAAGELRVFAGALCLDVKVQDRTSPATVQTYRCNGGGNQRWTVHSDGSITGVQSGLCLDVKGRATANGSVVELYTCNGGSNQRWHLGTGDTQAPTVPGDPRATNLTCNSVTFAWNASIDNVAVTHYDVYHDGQLMTSVSGTTRTTSLAVVPGATWGLYVNARDAAGNVSQGSNPTVTITPPPCQADTTPPSAPLNLVGSASGTTVTLSWSPATDNVGVRAYQVYRGGATVGTIRGTAALPPTTTFIDSGLTAATSFTYYVVALDAKPNSSAPSHRVTVTTGAACAAGSVCGVTQLTTDTDIPWGLVTLPDGSILYSRRDAFNLVRLDPVTHAKTNAGSVPNVDHTDGEGGLLGLAVAPNFATDHWLYVMRTTSTDNRIARFKFENGRLNRTSEDVLVKGILRNKYHNGGRLRFGPDGKLYASTGDAQNGDNAQNKAGLNGKVLRINPDGGVPSDNPFGNYVWSYGHRNPQGLAFDSKGRLWEQEFGNSVMDETNLITRGGNYGWPSCEGTAGSGCGTAGFIAPKHTYPTSNGSCSGIAIVRDVLYIACERGARLYREVISGASLTSVQSYFVGTYGRLRTVEPAPDGGLWLTTSTTGDKDSTPNNSNEKVLHVTLGR